MKASEILARGYEQKIAEIGDLEIPDLESVKKTYLAGNSSRTLRQCMFYIKKNRGVSYNMLDKKGKIVRKFMAFLIDPIVCQQNNLDNNLTTVLEEIYELNKERDRLRKRITELEARILTLETEQ